MCKLGWETGFRFAIDSCGESLSINTLFRSLIFHFVSDFKSYIEYQLTYLALVITCSVVYQANNVKLSYKPFKRLVQAFNICCIEILRGV